MTYREMLEAVKEIKRYCQRNKNCDCPFSDDEGICILSGDFPAEWRVSTWADWDIERLERERNEINN